MYIYIYIHTYIIYTRTHREQQSDLGVSQKGGSPIAGYLERKYDDHPVDTKGSTRFSGPSAKKAMTMGEMNPCKVGI